MPTTALHLAVGVSTYLFLKRYWKNLNFFYFLFVTILPDLEHIITLIILVEYRRPILFGLLHSITLVVTIALVVAVLHQALFGREKSALKFRWNIISSLIAVFTHFSLDALSKSGVPILAPITYQPNPFVIMTSMQANLLAIHLSLTLFLASFYLYRKDRRPILKIGDPLVMAVIIANKKLSYLPVLARRVERYFIVLAMLIEATALCSAAFPPLERLFLAVAILLTLILAAMIYLLHLQI